MPDILQILGVLTFSLAAIVYIRNTKRKEFYISELEKDGVKGFVITEVTYYCDRSFCYTEYAEDEDNTLPFLDVKEAEKVLKRLRKGKTKFKINKIG